MLVGDRPQVLWEGLAELRADAPSKARGAEGERGRPPPSSNTQRPITPRTRQTRPTKIVTFPRNKAEKSPFQQHDLSIPIVGPNQLKHRLSRTRKPKSHPSSNTQCPITLVSRQPRTRTGFVHPNAVMLHVVDEHCGHLTILPGAAPGRSTTLPGTAPGRSTTRHARARTPPAHTRGDPDHARP